MSKPAPHAEPGQGGWSFLAPRINATLLNFAAKLSELGVNDPAVDDFLRALLQKIAP